MGVRLGTLINHHMTGEEITTRFNLQIDDASELSDDETLELANEVYDEIANDRPWEWLRTTATGITSTTVSYVNLPANFRAMMPNLDNEQVVFVGTSFTPYKVVPYADRHSYRDQGGYCYIDVPNGRLVFTKQPTDAEAIEYDYLKVHDPIEADSGPLFRPAHHKIIVFGMAAAFNPIEQTEKSRSYQTENQDKYDELLATMGVEDAEAKLAYT